MALNRNNCLFYYSPLHTIGGQSEIRVAMNALATFDLLVMNVHTGSDILLMHKVIEGAKKMNSNLTVYAYVELGSVGSGAARVLADQWEVDAPSASGLIDGIFLDEFGHDFPSGTRAQQNGIVDYIHDNLNLPVFINAFFPTDVFGQPATGPNQEFPSVGADPLYRDLILVESFIFLVDASTPPKRSNWPGDRGRMDYYLAYKADSTKKLGICAMIGAGQGTGLLANAEIDELIYNQTLDYLNGESIDLLCVNYGSIGGTDQAFFTKNVANEKMPIPIASGAFRNFPNL